MGDIWFAKWFLCIIKICPGSIFHKRPLFSSFYSHLNAADLLQPPSATFCLHAFAPAWDGHHCSGPVSWQWQLWTIPEQCVLAGLSVVSIRVAGDNAGAQSGNNNCLHLDLMAWSPGIILKKAADLRRLKATFGMTLTCSSLDFSD